MNESDVMSRWSLQAMMNREKSSITVKVVEVPSCDSEVGCVGCPHLVRTRGLGMELLASSHLHLRTLCQSLTIEEPLNGGF